MLSILIQCAWFHGIMVSTLDLESSDPGSPLGWNFILLRIAIYQAQVVISFVDIH